MELQAEADKVERFLALMSPLVPTGQLAVLVTGVPRRSSHRQLRRAVIREAARVKAHRTHGLSRLQVHFGPGRSTYYDSGSLTICVDVGADARSARIRRMALLFACCVLLLVLLRSH